MQDNIWKKLAALRPLKRRAILIGGDDVESEPYRRTPSQGVKADIRAWKEFLLSDLGGDWEDNEILELTDVTADDVKVAVGDAGHSDFSLVAFSGHGSLRKDKWGFDETIMVLKDGQAISERELNTGSPWCVAIMDCCRNHPEGAQTATGFSKKAQMESLRASTRELYDEAILRSERGFVKVYSADVGQSAADKNSFTRHLIETAEEEIGNCSDGILTFRDAVRLTAPKMQPLVDEDGLLKQWNPVYDGGRRRGHFPFAVKPTPLHS